MWKRSCRRKNTRKTLKKNGEKKKQMNKCVLVKTRKKKITTLDVDNVENMPRRGTPIIIVVVIIIALSAT